MINGISDFTIQMKCLIGWSKEHTRWITIWRMWTLSTFGILYFQEQLFTAECNAKHVHYFPGGSDKVGESSRWKQVVLMNSKMGQARNLNFTSSEHWRVPSTGVNGISLGSTSKGEEKIEKVGCKNA